MMRLVSNYIQKMLQVSKLNCGFLSAFGAINDLISEGERYFLTVQTKTV